MSEYDIYVSTIFIKTKLDLSNCTPEGGGGVVVGKFQGDKEGKSNRKKERKGDKERTMLKIREKGKTK